MFPAYVCTNRPIERWKFAPALARPQTKFTRKNADAKNSRLHSIYSYAKTRFSGLHHLSKTTIFPGYQRRTRMASFGLDLGWKPLIFCRKWEGFLCWSRMFSAIEDYASQRDSCSGDCLERRSQCWCFGWADPGCGPLISGFHVWYFFYAGTGKGHVKMALRWWLYFRLRDMHSMVSHSQLLFPQFQGMCVSCPLSIPLNSCKIAAVSRGTYALVRPRTNCAEYDTRWCFCICKSFGEWELRIHIITNKLSIYIIIIIR